MLFRPRLRDDAVLRALRVAILAHHPAAVRALLAAHGEKAFVRALAGLSARARADVLSLLAPEERQRIRTARAPFFPPWRWLRQMGGSHGGHPQQQPASGQNVSGARPTRQSSA